jgi:hypothetical protein
VQTSPKQQNAGEVMWPVIQAEQPAIQRAREAGAGEPPVVSARNERPPQPFQGDIVSGQGPQTPFRTEIVEGNELESAYLREYRRSEN